MKVSVVVLTYNEEKNIERCLHSLAWCEEIVVIDSHSTDATVSIAKKKGAKVLIRDIENNFAQQRNFGLTKTKAEWVLFVDADEVVTPQLREEIQRINEDSIANIYGYYVKRNDYMWGRPLLHGEQGTTWLLRLGRKSRGKWKGTVHEVWDIKDQTGRLSSPILHYPHSTIAEFLKDINFYTTIRAEELYTSGIRSTWWSILFYTKAKFIQNFFVKGGFLDGMPGLIVALLMSFHSFLVRSKLWQLQDKN